MTTKQFDAIAMKRKGAAAIYEQTKNMSPAEEVKFWKKRTLALVGLQRRLKKKPYPKSPPVKRTKKPKPKDG